MRLGAGIATSVCGFALVLAPGAHAHSYGGSTVRAGAMTLQVSSGFDRLIALRAERELRCRKGRVLSFRRGAFLQRSVFARGSGSFYRGSIRVRGTRGSLVRRGRFSIRVRLTNHQTVARGVLRERVRLRDGTRCTSGRVRFFLPLVSTNE